MRDFGRQQASFWTFYPRWKRESAKRHRPSVLQLGILLISYSKNQSCGSKLMCCELDTARSRSSREVIVSEPYNFSWLEKPILAAMGRPNEQEEYMWLRREGVELLVTMTENALRRDWLSDAGLFALHLPVEDMSAPTQEQLKEAISAIDKA